MQANTVTVGDAPGSLRLSEHGIVEFSGHHADLIASLPDGMGTTEIRVIGTASVTKVGTGQIAGTPVTHYRDTVKSQLVDVWVDAQHRVRRLQVISSLPGTDTAAPAVPSGPSVRPSSASGQQRLQVTLNLSGYGTPVTVSPPPASQTIDLTRLFVSSPAPSSRTG